MKKPRAAKRGRPFDCSRKRSKDANPRVRWFVAGDTHAPSDVLAALATDNDPDVRMKVAQNPGTPEAVLQSLAEDKEQPVSQAALSALRKRRIPLHKAD